MTLSAALVASKAGAQEPLDSDRYVAIVLRASPAAAAGAGLDAAAESARRSARLWPDPGFELTWDRARPTESPGGEGTEIGYAFSQVILWPGTLAAGVQAGDRAADALRAEADQRRWELSAHARETFARLVAARLLHDIAGAAEQDARSLRDLVARRAELGEAREADRIKAQVEWLRQQSALATTRREAAAAEAILRSLAVEPLPDPLVLQAPTSVPLPPLDRDGLRARLQDSNPRARVARANAEREAALLLAARRSRIPDLAAAFFHEDEIDKTATGFSLGIRIPLWNANRGEIARARASLQVSTADAAASRIELTAELEASLAELETSSAQVALLDRELLPAAAQSVALVRFSYEEGETSLLELLDAQRTYREAQREAVDAGLARSLAVARAQRLLGPDFDPQRKTP